MIHMTAPAPPPTPPPNAHMTPQVKVVRLERYRDLDDFAKYMGYLVQKNSESNYLKAHIMAGIKVLCYLQAHSAGDGLDDAKVTWMHNLKKQVGKLVKGPRQDSQQLKEAGRWKG